MDAYYGVAEDSDKTSGLGVGLVLQPYMNDPSGWQVVGEWPRAVAGIAFGGLVPQVHPNIAKAVHSQHGDTGMVVMVE